MARAHILAFTRTTLSFLLPSSLFHMTSLMTIFNPHLTHSCTTILLPDPKRDHFFNLKRITTA
jgi:hypothetical protein